MIVTLNLYGDIISDIAAQIAGSVGMGGSANIGDLCAMFEAIHGSAPDIAGRGIANPSGLLNGAIMMLVHIGQPEVAAKIHNAWLCAIESGIHTGDIYKEGVSKERAGTEKFADAVIEHLGQMPHHFKSVSYKNAPQEIHPTALSLQKRKTKALVGVDVFLDWTGNANDLGRIMEGLNTDDLKLKMISNRGVKVYPDGMPETFTVDHWRCRYLGDAQSLTPITHTQVIGLLQRAEAGGLDFIKTEHLYTFDGVRGYSLGQGE